MTVVIHEKRKAPYENIIKALEKEYNIKLKIVTQDLGTYIDAFFILKDDTALRPMDQQELCFD